MVVSSISKFTEGISKAAHSTSTFIGMVFIVLTWYILGSFLHSETWELLRYKFRCIKENFTLKNPN